MASLTISQINGQVIKLSGYFCIYWLRKIFYLTSHIHHSHEASLVNLINSLQLYIMTLGSLLAEICSQCDSRVVNYNRSVFKIGTSF